MFSVPLDFTAAHGCFALYALQQWDAVIPHYPKSLAAGFFYNQVPAFLSGINKPSRKTVFKHLHTKACFVCHTPIDLTKTQGDHIIPLADGGPQDAGNTLLLCRRCNSSKGKKDLLAWWLAKAFPVENLPRDVLCLYARIHWQHYGAALFDQAVSATTWQFLLDKAACLPTDHHRHALIGATYAGCAQFRAKQHI